jgi:hypothetical protein
MGYLGLFKGYVRLCRLRVGISTSYVKQYIYVSLGRRYLWAT